MTIIEYPTVDHINKYLIEIRCDICDLFMYSNEVTHNIPLLHSAEFGLYICSICSKKILIKNLKI